MTDINIGIIGFGRIGAEHAGWISKSAGAKVAAVFDPTPARRELAEQRGFRTVDSVDALLADGSVEAVLVATPTSFHFDHATKALRAGKHAMIEKPMAIDFEQSLHIAQEAKSRNRVVSVFHNRRWDIDYLTVKTAIESRVLGRVFNVESRLGQWSSCVGPAAKEYRPNWRNENAFGGGGLFDWGSHFIDQLWQLMLPALPVRIYAQLRGNVWSKDCDDLARVVIDFDDGAVGILEINTTTTRPLPRWHIDGTAGTLESPHSLTFDTQVWAAIDFIAAEDVSTPRRLPTARQGLDEITMWNRFASAVRGEGEPAVTVESVLPTMLLLDLARQSSREGRSMDCASIRDLIRATKG